MLKLSIDSKGSNVAKVVENLFSLETNVSISLVDIGQIGPNGNFYYIGSTTIPYCGGPSNSSFYMYSKQNGVQRLFSNIQSTSGVAIDQKRKKLYHLEPCKQLLTEFDWDAQTGNIFSVFYMRNIF